MLCLLGRIGCSTAWVHVLAGDKQVHSGTKTITLSVSSRKRIRRISCSISPITRNEMSDQLPDFPSMMG